jgi:hypothetical protein
MLGKLNTELKVLFIVCTEGARISSPKVDGVTIFGGYLKSWITEFRGIQSRVSHYW